MLRSLISNGTSSMKMIFKEFHYVSLPSAIIDLEPLPPAYGGDEIDYEHVARVIAMINLESSFKYMRKKF